MTHLLPIHAVLAHFAIRMPRRQRKVRNSSSITKQTTTQEYNFGAHHNQPAVSWMICSSNQ
ncbi:hypothetical protein [Aeromonas allosaccharophila]|uniref:hypothetical protein n=1 Tax=Aeromonas allosaccharophila TaxID=656 RepID=UPI0010085C22|nr:hypothetical protein [Aeromonas allosaccharophila]